MMQIPITKGYFAIIDAEDYEKIKGDLVGASTVMATPQEDIMREESS